VASNNYTSKTVSGYNATPPADDGSAVAANRISWATIKTKLADPIKTLIAAIIAEFDTGMTTLEDGRVKVTLHAFQGATTHTYQSWCNKALIVCVGAGAAGQDYSAPDNGQGGGGGGSAAILVNNIKAVVGTATLYVGDQTETFASGNRSSSYSDSEGNSLEAPGAPDGGEGGTFVVTATPNAMYFPGSEGTKGVLEIGRGGNAFISLPVDEGVSRVGSGGVGGISTSTTGQQGRWGEIRIIEYE